MFSTKILTDRLREERQTLIIWLQDTKINSDGSKRSKRQ